MKYDISLMSRYVYDLDRLDGDEYLDVRISMCAWFKPY